MSETVLVTGGLGYIGGRVCRFLAEYADFHLRLGTRQAHQTPPHWLCNGKLAFLDLLDDSSLEKACRGVKYIVHLAALNEIDCAADPARALMINGLGSLRLLRAAITAKVERFVYFSTAHVYGAPLTGTLTEQTLPRPQHPYAITHRIAEDLVLAARDKGEIQGIVLRLSNGFGAPERANVNRWTLLANDLCRQAVTSGKLSLRSSGLQLRDFITLNDISRAVQHILTLSPEACADGLFNLGGENPTRIIDVAERIAFRYEQLFGANLAIDRPSPLPSESSLPLDYRIDKLKATGFELRANIDEEIDSTLELCHHAFTAEE